MEVTCSEWCQAMWAKCIEAGLTAEAEDYANMYNLWKGRGM